MPKLSTRGEVRALTLLGIVCLGNLRCCGPQSNDGACNHLALGANEGNLLGCASEECHCAVEQTCSTL